MAFQPNYLSKTKQSPAPEHLTNSSHYLSANGSSGHIVHTVEYILKTCDEEGEDSHVALLSYRATPIDHHLKSLTLANRTLKTMLPMSNRKSLTADSGHVKEWLKSQQEGYSHYYNQKAGPTLEPLHLGQLVQILAHHTKTKEPVTVLKAAKKLDRTQSKTITSEGEYRRKRSYLRPETTNPCAHSPPLVQVP